MTEKEKCLDELKKYLKDKQFTKVYIYNDCEIGRYEKSEDISEKIIKGVCACGRTCFGCFDLNTNSPEFAIGVYGDEVLFYTSDDLLFYTSDVKVKKKVEKFKPKKKLSKNKEVAKEGYQRYLAVKEKGPLKIFINEAISSSELFLDLVKGCSKKMFLSKKQIRRKLRILKKVVRMINQKENK